MPSDFTDNHDLFMDWVRRDERVFRPVGDKVHEYGVPGVDGARYEMYRCKFSTPGFKEYHRRLQVFLLWFIEGASYIDEKDENWECTLVFERREKGAGAQVYSVVGYATAYAFFHFPDKRRMRISQFLILPPYQKRGHGAELYKALHREYLVRSDVVDFGVEDPNDDFSDLRDLCDFRMLKERDAFAGLKAPVGKDEIEEVRKRTKLSKEVLMTMEPDERKEKLAETYQAVVEGYRNVLLKGNPEETALIFIVMLIQPFGFWQVLEGQSNDKDVAMIRMTTGGMAMASVVWILLQAKIVFHKVHCLECAEWVTGEFGPSRSVLCAKVELKIGLADSDIAGRGAVEAVTIIPRSGCSLQRQQGNHFLTDVPNIPQDISHRQ
ncbi:histone acetyltransferase 1 [Dinochytrium kinnereticum]|nr:histone acetyltransferase 1 [Dinochytrium kinnereticum]